MSVLVPISKYHGILLLERALADAFGLSGPADFESALPASSSRVHGSANLIHVVIFALWLMGWRPTI
jgi:hypothetical protein